MPSSLEPADSQRVENQVRLAKLAAEELASPYFAHLRIESGRQTRDVLLSSRAYSGSGFSAVDWKSAPLAEVFFAYDEGDEFDATFGGRATQGTVLERNLVRFEGGHLVEVVTPAARLVISNGMWRREPLGWPPLPPRPAALRKEVASPFDVELDAAQRRVVDLPVSQPVLVLGEAGHGKTTVALHRLARIRHAAKSRFRAAVIVPTEGLRRLVELWIERLQLRGVEAWLYDRWAATQARRAFPDIPRRESESLHGGLIRLKRHPALRVALQELAARSAPEPDDSDPEGDPKATAGEHEAPRVRREDLLHLFGDRALMQRVTAASAGSLTSVAVDEVTEHTRIQFSETSEAEYAHVDPDRLKTLDGRSIDEGTPMEDAATIDVEDYAVLFELDRLRAARAKGRADVPAHYDCIVLDEAQEFAPLELRLIGRSFVPGGSLIVAGDAEQQIDPTTAFPGWPSVLEELNAPRAVTTTLEASYRCPPDVARLAKEVREGRKPSAPSDGGPSLALHTLPHECHIVTWLISVLREIQDTDRGAPVAVVCRTPEEARRLHRLVKRGVGVHLALDGDFLDYGGVHITCVEEVKGLEFDTVVVPDATPSAYPDIPEARRALYVVMTRTLRRLVLVTPNRWTPLLGVE